MKLNMKNIMKAIDEKNIALFFKEFEGCDPKDLELIAQLNEKDEERTLLHHLVIESNISRNPFFIPALKKLLEYPIDLDIKIKTNFCELTAFALANIGENQEIRDLLINEDVKRHPEEAGCLGSAILRRIAREREGVLKGSFEEIREKLEHPSVPDQDEYAIQMPLYRG